MPTGYFGLAWTVLWQSTLVNAAIATLFYWLRVPLNGSSFFIPFEATFILGYIGLFALVVSGVVLFVFGFISPLAASWASITGWIAIYFAFVHSNGQDFREVNKALGAAGAVVYPLVAGGIWWRLLGTR